MSGTKYDSEFFQASEAKGRSWAIPLPGKRYVEELRASAALSAAGAYAVTEAVDVFKSRSLHLYIKATAAAIGNIVSIVPEISLDPRGSDSSFYAMGVTDGTVTVADLVTDPAGNYQKFNFGGAIFTPLNILTPAAKGTSDVLGMVVTLDVNQAYWIRFRIAESGVTGTPSTLLLSTAKST